MEKYKNIKIYLFLIIFIIAIILIFLMFLQHSNKINYIEKMDNSCKINFNNWWGEADKKSFEIFEYIFLNVVNSTKYDSIEIYSVFGELPDTKEPNKLYIQYSGEPFINDLSFFDINFVPEKSENKNIIIFPYFYYYCLTLNTDLNYLLTRRKLDYDNHKKSKFCIFSVSNGSCEERNQFFSSLTNKYKKVDSCGKIFNNIIPPDGGFASDAYFDFISGYKFMICFENTSRDNYFTEKLLNAYYNKTIPIYWGCSNVENYINMDSILYLKPNFTNEDVCNLINEIILLDNNDELYQKKYENVFFKNGELPDEFNINKIREKVDMKLLYNYIIK
jgi:hypothetical protein